MVTEHRRRLPAVHQSAGQARTPDPAVGSISRIEGPVVNSGREIQVLVGVVKLMTEVVIVIVVATRPPGVTTVQAIVVGKIVPEAVVRRRRRHRTTTSHQAAVRRNGAMQAIVAATITVDNNRAEIVRWRLHHRILVRGREIDVGTTGGGDRRLPTIVIVDRCDR